MRLMILQQSHKVNKARYYNRVEKDEDKGSEVFWKEISEEATR